MENLRTINMIIGFLFFACYAYQLLYILVPMIKKEKPHGPASAHSYAVLICARNEQTVIGDLLESLRNQTYRDGSLTVFVMADNCTDDTAGLARRAGAVVYERFNTRNVGKGYALDALLRHISMDYPEGFDGYFVFDADNILEPDYIEQMNRTFSDGFDIVTSYRNSKNYGDNWISAGYALWFLRESRYLNEARMLLGNSCAVSGTGFLFSRRILEKTGGWNFHLLTEDIEFTVHQVVDGERIGICPEAILYDEQPISFSQSWRQRLRWAKGYLQVFQKNGRNLLKGIFSGNFSCFDMSMSILPAFVLMVASIIFNVVMITVAASRGIALHTALQPALESLAYVYVTLFLAGGITTVTEWKYIRVSTVKKIFYTFTFPLFMLTYIPISLAALFTRVEWKPIEHHATLASLPVRRT